MAEERTFNLRFSLRTAPRVAEIDDDELDEDAWLREWEAVVKPGLIRAVFAHLRSFDAWQAHVRNRGIPPGDEIEIVCTRRLDTETPRP